MSTRAIKWSCVLLWTPLVVVSLHFPSTSPLNTGQAQVYAIYTIQYILLLSLNSLTASTRDYVAMPEVISFGSCENRVCVDVHTIDDDIIENEETFTVTLRVDSSLSSKIRVKSQSRIATITIHDNDGV